MSESMLMLLNLGFILLFLVFPLVTLVLFLWMLIHCLRNRGISDTMKLIWVILMLLCSPVAPVVYFFTDRKKAKVRYYYEPTRVQAPLPSWSANDHANYRELPEPHWASEAPATPSRAQWEQYEEPQATYPEPPQEQQQQQQWSDW
ncbi:phospholipase D-like protein [Thermosporothrix hazakensis]|jgi:glucan phosphoethanolaminetransferase (alkaline phosphatase superfamily)|uniref:Phospholipase D-like protein n=1 Tax=Thermosporothrix hazakensis TaxID=644383 RepID=A0A326U6A9_THEHA|nr:PLDc N-terminal domain-containing protein [Thermosporothrix hazakensis]PZW29501.1 phospholipase D-like protein [Thermosporothrix hazakensis]GCE45784.1 hypothetical protein KTH_06530 [Thermosporothrix hazakensis]